MCIKLSTTREIQLVVYLKRTCTHSARHTQYSVLLATEPNSYADLHQRDDNASANVNTLRAAWHRFYCLVHCTDSLEALSCDWEHHER